MDLLGKTLGKYRIEEEVGRGSISVCYKATNTILGKTVALKVLAEEFRNDPLVVSVFQDKAQSGAQLKHPSIVDVHDMVADGDLLFIVSDFVAGDKLSEVVESQGRLEVREGLRIVAALADALDSAHRAYVIHHNIKPHNVILQDDGTPVIIDFGIAIAGLIEMLPGQDGVIGRVRFMSPEELCDLDVDYRTDLWGLGVTAYYLFTGEFPFDGESVGAVKEKVLLGIPASLPSEMSPDIPGDLDPMILKLLSLDPRDRYVSARGVRDAILDLLERLEDSDQDTPTVVASDNARASYERRTSYRRRDLGSYRLLELKGTGSFAMVYMAEDLRSGRMVALKLLKPEFADSEDVIGRFRQEAEFAQRIRHANVVDFYEFGVEELPGGRRDLYFTMEYIEGPRLKDLIQVGRPLMVPRAMDVVEQAAQGLQAAHEVGIIHRDLKPSNILIDKTGRALIADFGIAVAHFIENRLTATGMLLGTYAYMSPEQATGRDVTPVSDLYSLGVTLYEMVTGSVPFSEGAPFALLRRIVEDEPQPFPPALDIPPALEELTMRMLRKKPGARVQSAAEVVEALRQIRQGMS